jgi:hypothetical protein
MARETGERTWLIPDGYLPPDSTGGLISHESVCVLNTGGEAATIALTVYFEDRDPIRGLQVTVPGERTLHARLDRLSNAAGEKIPVAIPYALLLESDQPITVQMSRMDTTQAALTLMTTMAHPLRQG